MLRQRLGTSGLPRLGRIFWSLIFVFSVICWNLLPAILLRQPAYAYGTITHRQITLGSSNVSTANTYSVNFRPGTAASIKSIVVDFCNAAGGGAIIGSQCSSANHPVSGITTSGSVSVTQVGTSGSPWSFTAVAPNANIGNGKALVIQLAAGTGALSTSTALTFSFTATNPSVLGTFYARILTFSDTASSTTYDSTTSGSNNPPTTNLVDEGSVALSTANQLTVNAVVEESLQFCVAATDVDDSGATTVANDCSAPFHGSTSGTTCGTTVNLGILDSSVVSHTPVPTTPTSLPGGGNNCNGAAMVRTNAAFGVAITYFAEQETSSGQLKVVGAACTPSSNTDQCFNDSTTQTAFTAGTEDFGVTVKGTNCNGTSTTAYACDMTSGTNKLVASSGYIGGAGGSTTTYGDTNGWAWDHTGATEQLASSTGPVDDETLILGFAATPVITTPTGSYTVTSTYIATSTF